MVSGEAPQSTAAMDLHKLVEDARVEVGITSFLGISQSMCIRLSEGQN